jgi:hypothetical protein
MGSVTCCPYAKIGVDRTVQNSHFTVFCSVPLVFLKSGVLRTVNGATCSKKMPVVVESTFELEFTRTAAVKVQSSFFLLQYNLLFKNEDMVLFCGCIRVYSTMFYKNIFFRSNNIKRHKNGLLWL